MAIERTVEVERAKSDAAIAAFVVEHYDRLLRLARLVCRDTSDASSLKNECNSSSTSTQSSDRLGVSTKPSRETDIE